MYTPSLLTCPGSLVWATDIERGPFDTFLPFAHCPFCQARLKLEPGDRSGTLPPHDAADDRLPIPTADLPDFIAETQADVETRTDPFERDVVNHVFARLVAMYEASTRTPCVDPDHGIGDHPCDEVLGAERAAFLRSDAFERAREFDRTHPGYWDWQPGVDDKAPHP